MWIMEFWMWAKLRKWWDLHLPRFRDNFEDRVSKKLWGQVHKSIISYICTRILRFTFSNFLKMFPPAPRAPCTPCTEQSIHPSCPAPPAPNLSGFGKRKEQVKCKPKTNCLFTFCVKDLEDVDVFLLNIRSESAYEFEDFVDLNRIKLMASGWCRL